MIVVLGELRLGSRYMRMMIVDFVRVLMSGISEKKKVMMVSIVGNGVWMIDR